MYVFISEMASELFFPIVVIGKKCDIFTLLSKTCCMRGQTELIDGVLELFDTEGGDIWHRKFHLSNMRDERSEKRLELRNHLIIHTVRQSWDSPKFIIAVTFTFEKLLRLLRHPNRNDIVLLAMHVNNLQIAQRWIVSQFGCSREIPRHAEDSSYPLLVFQLQSCEQRRRTALRKS